MFYLSGRKFTVPCLLYSLFLHAVIVYLFVSLPLITGKDHGGVLEVYLVHKGKEGKAAPPPLALEGRKVEREEKKAAHRPNEAKRALGGEKGAKVSKAPSIESRTSSGKKRAGASGAESKRAAQAPPPLKAAPKTEPPARIGPTGTAASAGTEAPGEAEAGRDSLYAPEAKTESLHEKTEHWVPGIKPEAESGDFRAKETLPEVPDGNEETQVTGTDSGVMVISSGSFEGVIESEGIERKVALSWVDKKKIIKPKTTMDDAAASERAASANLSPDGGFFTGPYEEAPLYSSLSVQEKPVACLSQEETPGEAPPVTGLAVALKQGFAPAGGENQKQEGTETALLSENATLGATASRSFTKPPSSQGDGIDIHYSWGGIYEKGGILIEDGERTESESIVLSILTPEKEVLIPRDPGASINPAEDAAYEIHSGTAEFAGKIEDGRVLEAKAATEKTGEGMVSPVGFFHPDIKVEFFTEGAPSGQIRARLLRKPHPSARSNWETAAVGEESHAGEDGNPAAKRVFTVTGAEKGSYEFVLENEGDESGEVKLAFRIFEGKPEERVKEYKMELLPHGVSRVRFLVPEAVFWDDDDFFTGVLEAPGHVTKFNAETGLSWKEKKEE